MNVMIASGNLEIFFKTRVCVHVSKNMSDAMDAASVLMVHLLKNNDYYLIYNKTIYVGCTKHHNIISIYITLTLTKIDTFLDVFFVFVY